MSANFKKTVSYLLKAGVFVLVIWYCYRLLTKNNALKDFQGLILGIDPITIWLTLITVFSLMLVNWLLEALKWRFLCDRFQPISLREAIVSVFSGLSWAVFTPNRIGEYGGRVLFLKPRKRVFGVIGMLVGSISQMVITNVIGILAVCWFVITYLELSTALYVLVFLGSLLYLIFFLLLYFNIGLVSKWLLKVKFLRKFKRFFGLLLRYSKADLRRIFAYSILRYIVFTSQYCILMQIIIPGLPFIEMILMVFILFFVQSALPSLDLFDVGVRSITASYFFGFITPHIVAVMAVSACVWFVNLILPAIIGSILVFKINFFGARNN